jgi:hypothetical protein
MREREKRSAAVWVCVEKNVWHGKQTKPMPSARILVLCAPTLVAASETSDMPLWEVALISGSGGLALLLLVYAVCQCYSSRRAPNAPLEAVTVTANRASAPAPAKKVSAPAAANKASAAPAAKKASAPGAAKKASAPAAANSVSAAPAAMGAAMAAVGDMAAGAKSKVGDMAASATSAVGDVAAGAKSKVAAMAAGVLPKSAPPPPPMPPIPAPKSVMRATGRV